MWEPRATRSCVRTLRACPWGPHSDEGEQGMGIYDRDYMREPNPEPDWTPPPHKKLWIAVTAVVILVLFLYLTLR